jgi:transposase
MNSKDLFSMALGLQHPWKLNQVDFVTEADEKILRIDIGFEKGAKFSDPDSGEPSPVHDTMERRWRHLNFFEHTCYIHCKVPRVRCADGKVKQTDVPWARKGSGFTMLFEAYSMMLIEYEMPVNRVGKTMREYPNRIWTIFDHWVGQAYEKADHSQVEQLGVDETSSRKGHSYITIGVDMDERRVIHATEGKGAATIESIKDYLETKQTPPEQISQVCIDLSPAFISGVEAYFPNAQITFDRFHVKALLNKAMDEVRKQERRRHVALKGHKYTFLKSPKQLTEAQSVQRHALIELYPQLGEAYRLKELFDDFWTMKTPQEACGFLAFWCDMVKESEIAPFMKFVNTVKTHWDGILNYITSKLTNGILEGINSKIQLIKRRARGYRNITNFINMIYFTCGKLQFDYPYRST